MLNQIIKDIVEQLFIVRGHKPLFHRKPFVKFFEDIYDDDKSDSEAKNYFKDEVEKIQKTVEYIKNKKIKGLHSKRIIKNVIKNYVIINVFTNELFYLEKTGETEFKNFNDRKDADVALFKSKIEIVRLYGDLALKRGIKYLKKYLNKRKNEYNEFFC